MATIQEFANGRNIKVLWHFTRLENLDSILANGLLPKGVCGNKGLQPLISDDLRLDGTDALCLSIGFPNYKMFWGYRKDNTNADWAVIAVKPEVLWTKKCAFCTENAAKASISCQSIESRQGLTALQRLYDDFEGRARKDLGIPDALPTNPQAEVLCFDAVGPELIAGMAFSKQALQLQYATSHPKYKSVFLPGLFNARIDHQYWKK